MCRCSQCAAILLFYLLVQSLQGGCKEWCGWARPFNGEEISQAELGPWFASRKGLDMQEQGIVGIEGNHLIGGLLPENVVAWLQGIGCRERTGVCESRVSFALC